MCHITSVHTRYDTRIFLKMCTSLAKDFRTILIVADGRGDETINGVMIKDIGTFSSRLKRITRSPKLIFAEAINFKADLYHIHDPELLPVAARLIKKGFKVIFDSHEDFPKQLLSKPYLAPWKAKILSKFAEVYESLVLPKLTFLVAATPSIREKNSRFNSCVDINNYPLLNELQSDLEVKASRNSISYVGGISTIRGICELLNAMELIHDSRVVCKIAGRSPEKHIQRRLEACESKNVEYLGQQTRVEVKSLLEESFAGIVTFLPVPNHIDAQPNKMFEYMSAGIPVIGSRFPLWQEIIEGNACGICVDPNNPKEIADAIIKLSNDSALVDRMGRNGREAVESKYNWDSEYTKLKKVYEKLIND